MSDCVFFIHLISIVYYDCRTHLPYCLVFCVNLESMSDYNFRVPLLQNFCEDFDGIDKFFENASIQSPRKGRKLLIKDENQDESVYYSYSDKHVPAVGEYIKNPLRPSPRKEKRLWKKDDDKENISIHFATASQQNIQSDKKENHSRKVTIPQSPALRCKLRTRGVVDYLPREERELLEFEKEQKQQVKAKPLNPAILKAPQCLKKIESKPVTKPEPFHLTEVKEKVALPEEPHYIFVAKPVPEKILRKPVGIPEKEVIPATKPHTPAVLKKCMKPKILEEVTEVSLAQHACKSSNEGTRCTVVKPFQLEERVKAMFQKKEEKIKKVYEDEAKARIFHANPLPAFIAKGSKGNNSVGSDTSINTTKCDSTRSTLDKCSDSPLDTFSFKARPAKVLYTKPFCPEKGLISPTQPVEVHLNTEERSKAWVDFQKQLQEKEEEVKQVKLMIEERERLAQEEELRQLKKMAEFKAQPIRCFKKFEIKPSDKPFTVPASPGKK